MKKYGLVSSAVAVIMATAVCDVIGHGSNNTALSLLIETAAAETLLGDFRDTTDYAAGTSLTQQDEPTFDWLKGKYANHSINEKLKANFDVDLAKVEYRELEHSPLLAFIFCRLRYYVVPAPIPTSLEGRANYWKQHYNSSAGKGTPAEYIHRCFHVGTQILLA